MTSPNQDDSVEQEGTAWKPEVGDRVVLVYPPEWNKADVYGEVMRFDDDGAYYISEATLGTTKLINPPNLEMHGGHVRPLRLKEKWPTAKVYVSSAEKRVRKEKEKKRQGRQ